VSQPHVLQHRRSVDLTPAAPFHFDVTLYKPDHFPSADNLWQPGIRWQTMRWQGVSLGLKLENRGTVDEPRLQLSIWSESPLSQPFLDGLLEETGYRYGLRMDLTEFNRRFLRDPQLGPLVERWRGMRPCNYHSLYEYLILAIVLQNTIVRRSINMMQALFQRYGTLLSFDGQQLYCFWEPGTIQVTTEEDLRQLKVGYRARSIKRISETFVRHEIDELDLRCKGAEEQRQALLRLYGVGPASVGYILGDVFHHWDEMNHISPWEQRIYSKLFFDADPETPLPVSQLLGLFQERFAGYRLLAVHYIWEDLFWRRTHEHIPWLEKLIRR
jgi:3-methyladenine DNA glycosylase/8-oxoguanine DNA glycosylase